MLCVNELFLTINYEDFGYIRWVKQNILQSIIS